MLYSLSVSNYILIGSLETSFPEGLIIISGETGAGKSILLGALSLVLGSKADASMVGPLGDNCVVEAEFGLDESLKPILEAADLPADGDRLVLRRTVGKSGRSRSFCNDEPVSLPVLQELAAHLVDIHSQHQTLRLQDERFRLEALDLRSGASALRNSCAEAWNKVLECRHILASLQERLRKAVEEQEYNQSRWQRLDQAGLLEGEVESLEAEQKQLAHAEEIKETLCNAERLLSPEDDEVAAPSQLLREATRELEKAARFIPSMKDLAERLNSVRLEMEDIADEVSATNSRTEASPQRLEQVEERLSLLYSLLQKHGMSTVEELIAERDRLKSLVADASSLEAEVASASKALADAEKAHLAICKELHGKRAAGAPALSESVEKQLHGLDLDHAAFKVSLEETTPGPTGSDSVHFLFSSTGKNLSDVAKAASGGELSRIMLSLKAEMARFSHMPTLVFDEIDTGVSGSTADKMGSLVCAMGADMQVFAITHLPQVAAKGSAHYLVSKEKDVTGIRLLDSESRVQEVARMLSGSTVTPAAIANARALLNV
ncbi:MAG: DNA repair protein RecN [Bacteroidales bacterium]|nr:DNA repair protein RecN [Bacteroidales bacterium]